MTSFAQDLLNQRDEEIEAGAEADKHTESTLKPNPNLHSDKELVRLWDYHLRSINVIATQARPQKPPPSDPVSPDRFKQTLHNPFENFFSARRLDETVEEFLKRVPILQIDRVKAQDAWIWIANFRFREQNVNREAFKQSAEITLQKFLAKATAQGFYAKSIQMSKRHNISVQRNKAKEEILQAAIDNQFTSGKWLLFVSDDDCSRIWAQVCHAVSDNKLGTAAKIAVEPDEPGKDRVICIYTKNFSDKKDLQRVLLELKRFDLLPEDSRSRPIYYKCDAFTELDIMSGNKYGFAASLYSSKDILAMKAAGL